MTDNATDPMERAEFRQLAETYGSNLAVWPSDKRAPAQRLLSDDPSARDALREAANLDALLGSVPVARPGAALRARVMADFDRVSGERASARDHQRPAGWRFWRGEKGADWVRRSLEPLGWSGPLWQPVGALAACLVIGLAAGYSGPISAETQVFASLEAVSFDLTDWSQGD
ncbi:MAG: hypothetical protein AAGH45_09375 [Pseudomonadota bacterium]